MDKEKQSGDCKNCNSQIEEIARILASSCGDCSECNHFHKEVNGIDSCYFKYAEMVYNADFRKQSVVIRCKDCEHFYQVGDVRICRHWNYHTTKEDAYCSYAKMKGGAE